jgi:hypothetical protein
MFVDLPDIIKRGFPILSWSKSYNVDKAVADLVAGITIGLTLIPQCIAYASLAGLAPQVSNLRSDKSFTFELPHRNCFRS